MSEAEFERLVERLDLNSDGCINFDEFAAGLLDWEKVRAPGSGGRVRRSLAQGSGFQTGRRLGLRAAGVGERIACLPGLCGSIRAPVGLRESCHLLTVHRRSRAKHLTRIN